MKTLSTTWFEVSKKGLGELQQGKPKHFVVRELIQNAWDEDTKVCELDMNWNAGVATVVVTDDSPEGFKRISDSFTLFAPTEKRGDPKKRGRFNFGEKQVLSICEKAEIKTTTGTIIFDKNGRHQTSAKTKTGSVITVFFKCTLAEFDEVREFLKLYRAPRDIEFKINGETIEPEEHDHLIEVKLLTEHQVDGTFRPTTRMAEVQIKKATEGQAYLYEMGIPVTDIECDYHIDVQQKVPLSHDRDKVPASFLKAIYAELVNAVHKELTAENVSQGWVRTGVSSDRINKDAVASVLRNRYGDKVVVADRFDPNSIDRAISEGYKVLQGSELSKEEWANVKRDKAIESSSALFGSGTTGSGYENAKVDSNMQEVASLAIRIAKRFLNIDVNVTFKKWPGNVSATYGSRTLTFNVQRTGRKFYEATNRAGINSLIIHELGHEKGAHYESSYIHCITELAGDLIELSISEPEFFNLKGVEETCKK